MNGRPLLALGAGLVAASLAAACNLPIECAGVGIPGIVAEVKDPSGNVVSAGAMVVAQDADVATYADTAGPLVVGYDGSLNGPAGSTVMLAWNRDAKYVVTASKPHWTTATANVRVWGGKCGWVEPAHLTLTIEKLPGAPPVRSVAIAPRRLRFGFCGSSARAESFVEADVGISGEVIWFSEDTTVVTVIGGLVKVKSRGNTRVAARSVADSSIVGYMPVVVDPVCP